jgi:outer membrane immunogenic protein
LAEQRPLTGGVHVSKIFIAAFAAAVFWCAAASAADMPTKAPVSKAEPKFDWNGFYAGVNAGYVWGTRDQVTTDITTGAVVGQATVNPSGWLGGGQIGYNWMFAPAWLLGVEADFSGSSFKDIDDSPVATGYSRQTWFATARGRLGYVANNWLFYGTGGGVWSGFHPYRTILPGLPSAGETSSPSLIVSGWTAGGGVEVGLAQNWIAKFEYLYMKFPTAGFDFTYSVAAAGRHVETGVNANVVRVGINYLFHAGP